MMNIDQLLPRGCHVLCALSGGRDSVYLLYRLLEWAEEREMTVSAAHYNHHLRGEESDRDESFVRNLCASLGVPVYVDGGDVMGQAAQQGKGIEETAREMRYAFLERVCDIIGADLIATAHHANDLAETMLMNLVRGAGAKGLRGIPPKRGNVVRPILHILRSEIDAYLEKHGICYVEDSSNALDDNKRNLLRHQVMPILEQMNPAFVQHCVQASELLMKDDAYLQKLADDFLREQPVEKGIDGKALLALDEAVAGRVLRSVWKGIGTEDVSRILALCAGEELRYLHVPGAVIRYDTGRLWSDFEIIIPDDRELNEEFGSFYFGDFKIRWKKGILKKGVHNSFNTFCLKCENIVGAVAVTSKRDGDRVKLQGHSHTKKLKHLFQERKLTQPQRAAVPVFRDEQGVLAVYGFGIAQRCVPEVGEEVIIINCEN